MRMCVRGALPRARVRCGMAGVCALLMHVRDVHAPRVQVVRCGAYMARARTMCVRVCMSHARVRDLPPGPPLAKKVGD